MQKITKQKINISPATKEQTLEKFFRYFELSSLLFDRNKDEIYNVTDIPKESKFHSMAKEMAAQLQIDWASITHEESNRIMLAMLEESFNLIRDIEDSKCIIIKTTIQVTK